MHAVGRRDRAGVKLAGRDTGPVGDTRRDGCRYAAVHRRAVTQLAGAVLAPAQELAVADRARIIETRRHLAPPRDAGGLDLQRLGDVADHGARNLAVVV